MQVVLHLKSLLRKNNSFFGFKKIPVAAKRPGFFYFKMTR
jgi:hypothetical protein